MNFNHKAYPNCNRQYVKKCLTDIFLVDKTGRFSRITAPLGVHTFNSDMSKFKKEDS